MSDKRNLCQTIAFPSATGHIKNEGRASYISKTGKPDFKYSLTASANPNDTRFVKKTDYGKIVDERKNYRLYLSGIGYVDEEPPKPLPKPVVRAPPVKKEPEMETITEVKVEKVSDGQDPDWKFTNLGVTSRDDNQGKRTFYRVIQATPEGDSFAEFKKITRTYKRPKKTQS